ncbi:NAD(P)/FAD-dependent oxidoreductase [Campylobacter geochelonis]|uniref:NAD(P)/FAD-dependent oxidoreductase n=1 Tax=Campylobacter geochelonis TaxID=1780362 RepID=UPI00077076B2|nr:NAD(P)/FAD-dependent oxidoreductase [Campylobacter geochelonis]CZE50426.1 NADH dehydrogenase [Campylobacter geochelonis]
MIKILVLGGGYAGLSFIKNLPDEIFKKAQITLINANQFHYHTALLHKVAAGECDKEALFDIKKVIDKRVNFVVDEVAKIEENTVFTKDAKFEFDYLIIALGFEKETFGCDGMENSREITTYAKSLELKNEIYSKFDELADKKRENLDIVICGGGLSGVEFAGALAREGAKYAKDKFDFKKVKITLVEALPQILPMYDEKLHKKASEILQNLGVLVLENSKVVKRTKAGILLENERVLNADVVVWVAGIRGNSVVDNSKFKNHRARLLVDENLKFKDNIYAIGDVAKFKEFAPTAQIACQMGAYLGKNINLLIDGKNAPKFSYQNKGLICSIGKERAVGNIFGQNISGKFAVFMKWLTEKKWDVELDGVGAIFGR